MMRGEAFLKAAVGERGVEALSKTAERLPDLEAVVLPRVAMAWLHTASDLGYEGRVPGTEAVIKSDTIAYGGNSTTIKDNFLAAVSLLCIAAGCNELAIPDRLRPSQVAYLAKSIDLLTKTRFLKRVQDLEEASGGEGSQTSTPGQDASQTSSGNLEKGLDMPGKAAAPRGPQAPTAAVPQTKQQGKTQAQPKPAVGTDGNKKPLTQP